jgi:vitamin K-dependent gamma-carboxylase
MYSYLKDCLFKPIDNSQLILFRVLFGLLMVAESFGAILTGWVHRVFMTSQMTFSFIGLEWLKPLPGDGMYWYYSVMGIVSLLFCLGYRYRITSVLLALMWSAVYLMQKTSYNNHYYLTMLICWFMVLVDAHGNYSLDAKRTGIRITTCPNWIRLFFILQVLIVFSFAAVAKLSESWSSGEFVQYTFARKSHYWLIGPLLANASFQTFITYSGLIFDATVIPALLWKRTRMLALIGLVVFNLFNSAVFQIGIFPYMVLALTAFFYEPTFIQKLVFPKREPVSAAHAFSTHPYIVVLFVAYFLWQLYLPLRHHLIPGDVTWREEGHRLSWRMMLRAKSGRGKWLVKNPQTGEFHHVNPNEYLNRKQIRRMYGSPDIVWQFAQHLKKEYQKKGVENAEVYCQDCVARLNGGKSSLIIDPEINLAQASWNYFGRNEWVLDR